MLIPNVSSPTLKNTAVIIGRTSLTDTEHGKFGSNSCVFLCVWFCPWCEVITTRLNCDVYSFKTQNKKNNKQVVQHQRVYSDLSLWPKRTGRTRTDLQSCCIRAERCQFLDFFFNQNNRIVRRGDARLTPRGGRTWECLKKAEMRVMCRLRHLDAHLAR